MKPPSIRKAKKRLKTALREMGIPIEGVAGNIFFIPPIGQRGNRNVACIRRWSFVAITPDHPKLQETMQRHGKP